MRSLRDRLRDIHHKKITPPPTKTSPEQDTTQWQGFSWQENEWGKYLAKRTQYSLELGEGLYQLHELYREDLGLLEMITHKKERINIEDLLFFDTETTGLGTGTGVAIFLFGLGYFQEDSFVLEQLFLPDISSEPSLLHDFASRINQFKGIISYNGKAFDWNLVASRFSLHRLPLPGHLSQGDLLYPARRLWKKCLPSCRLQEVESSCLHIRRKEDVPGYLAPQLYFEFLRSRQFSLLEGVFQHNRLDILSLVYLLIHLLKALNGTTAQVNADEKIAIGKWLMEWGQHERATQRLEGVLEDQALSRSLRGEVYQTLAGWWKREKNWPKAIRCWEQWLQEAGWDITPYVELAKYYEHQEHNVDQAIHYTRQAIDLLLQKKMLRRSSLIQKQMGELKHRENRLLEKQSKKGSPLDLDFRDI
ncbi:ribonuclease H-like domain-containing protein [Paenactinomyces guangxiensis]|uniref:Ribonuclease H-like domain-containing protein n=1 Tax=Paenactinomyces guangxiensis TaxID=1490290 RepID=A0A7W2A8T5_9BACL|nr:ribonuclease H-like domain-containing protein [Paenactinomyces guangxiensis]MBA4494945.1 ribonuclease H-like domain-containing protein [Paenactinomyces guangxiensis]MBH8592028.1 ribonuclease H-like domain-containing protein [Paenactinomyces guangxiensis]